MQNTTLATKINQAFGTNITDAQIDSLPRQSVFCGIRFPIFANEIAKLIGFHPHGKDASYEDWKALCRIEDILSEHYSIDLASPFNPDPPKDAPNYDWHRKGPQLPVVIRR